MVQRTISAADFEADCLSFLDEVAATGVPLVVTKNGRRVARIEPVSADAAVGLRGSIVREGNLISPFGPISPFEDVS